MAWKFNFNSDPFANFTSLMSELEMAAVKDFNAFFLATVSEDGRPHVRTVLYKGLLQGGLSFFTNYNSAKARNMAKNPNVSALFFWSTLFQQVKVEGQVQRLSREESENYFRSRPRLSQLGAWASDQSTPISGLQELEEKLQKVEQRFAQQEVPCPPHWGGYAIVPLRFEFWFGREGRLHERYVFERKTANEEWQRAMLSP